MMERSQQSSNLPGERNPVSLPQLFVHLEFGISWSQRHTPRPHTVTYTSRSLRDARLRSSFPRQLPPPNANFLASDDRQDQPRDGSHELQTRGCHSYGRYQQQQQQQQRRRRQQQQEPQQQHRQRQYRYHAQEHEQRSRGHDRSIDPSHACPRPSENDEPEYERRQSRSGSRGVSYERGNSAPPPFHDSPWDNAPDPSASLFPTATRPTDNQPRLWKPLPAEPSNFRLGEDGLPWSAWAWPPDSPERARSEEREVDSPYTNRPTTVPLPPTVRDEDPERVRELECLGAAMATVDNGFENQWWHQGPRETTTLWWPRDQEEPSRLSMADALLLSAAEPPVSAPLHGWYAPSFGEEASLFDGIISPVSSDSPARPLRRSLTTRSEELFVTVPR